jgi:hypothetical protein
MNCAPSRRSAAAVPSPALAVQLRGRAAGEKINETVLPSLTHETRQQALGPCSPRPPGLQPLLRPPPCEHLPRPHRLHRPPHADLPQTNPRPPLSHGGAFYSARWRSLPDHPDGAAGGEAHATPSYEQTRAGGGVRMTGVPELSGHRCNNNHGRTSANAFHPDRRLNLNSEFGGSAVRQRARR